MTVIPREELERARAKQRATRLQQKTETDDPCDLDAEAVVLSACLLSPARCDQVLAILRPEHFHAPTNRAIMSAIVDLATAQKPVDVATVLAWLKVRGMARMVGSDHLAVVTDASPAVHNVEAHARIVRDLWRLRCCIAEATAIAKRGRSAGAEVQVYLDTAASRIAAIAEADRETSVAAFREIIGDEFAAVSEAASRGSVMTGIASGFPKVDALTCGWQPGELFLIGARPGMGKTAMMMQTAINVAWHSAADGVADQWVLVFSLEMARGLIARRALASEAAVDSNKIRGGGLEAGDWARLTEAARGLSAIPVYVDDSSKPSPIEIRAKSRRLASTADAAGRRLAMICVDYVQLVDGRPLMRHGDQRHRELGLITSSLKTLAKELRVPVIVCAQLNRPTKSAGCPPPPQLSDLRESGDLEQDADGVIFIHRPEYYFASGECPEEDRRTAQLILAKQRNGPTGIARMFFDAKHTRFSDTDPLENKAY